MSEVLIKEDFEAYPGDVRRAFVAGQVVTDLPEDFVDIIVAKGHAERVYSKAKKEPDA